MTREEKYFPDGCPICAGKVTLNKEAFKYICEGCGAYADSHRDTTKYNKKYEPTEEIAGQKIHELRNHIRTTFSRLYLERVNIMKGNKSINTALVNIIYPQHIIKVNRPEDEEFAFVFKSDDENYEVIKVDNGEMLTIPANEITNISNRDKALIWLSQRLGLQTSKCNIGMFNENQLKHANEFIHQETMEAIKKSLEST